MKLKLALLCVLGMASVNAMACYTVFDRSNQVVYNAQLPPVDMSRPLHETLPVLFPGGHMVFGAGADCPREAPATVAAAPAPARPSPLLTDRGTAAAMHVKHSILPSGVALVTNPPATIGGGVTVLASSPMPLVVAPAVATRKPQQRPEVVITEMHNPPLTVVHQGGMIVSALR